LDLSASQLFLQIAHGEPDKKAREGRCYLLLVTRRTWWSFEEAMGKLR
jgi:hypothetical protein